MGGFEFQKSASGDHDITFVRMTSIALPHFATWSTLTLSVHSPAPRVMVASDLTFKASNPTVLWLYIRVVRDYGCLIEDKGITFRAQVS